MNSPKHVAIIMMVMEGGIKKIKELWHSVGKTRTNY